MLNKHTQRYLTSLIIKGSYKLKPQWDTTTNWLEWLQYKQTNNLAIPTIGENAEWRIANNHFGNSSSILYKVKHTRSIWTGISTHS